MARNHPYQGDVCDVEALLRRILQEGEAMKTHTDKDVYLALGATGLNERFSLAHTHPDRYMFTDELRMRLKRDEITPESWDALQAYRQTRQTGAAAAPYTLDQSTNVASLPADLEKALENMVDSLFPEMPPLE